MYNTSILLDLTELSLIRMIDMDYAESYLTPDEDIEVNVRFGGNDGVESPARRRTYTHALSVNTASDEALLGDHDDDECPDSHPLMHSHHLGKFLICR